MALKTETETVLKFDNETLKMERRIEVTVQLVSNKGTVMKEVGPLYAKTGQDVWQLEQILKRRLVQDLPGMPGVIKFD